MVAAGAGGTTQHLPDNVFALPTVGVSLAAFVLISSYRRGKVRACFWVALPALGISVITIFMALTA
jgi:hypothetical protein